MGKNLNRRDFFKISAVGGATVAVTSCRPDPVEEIIPMLVPPYDYVPGISIHYATTCQECSAGCGLVVRTREGRAIKAEGNPAHPLNKGRICVQGQAALQGLYSPSRAAGPSMRQNGTSQVIDWAQGKQLLSDKLKQVQQRSESKILYLGPPRSGTFPEMLAKWLKGMGGGTTFAFDMSPVNSLLKANEIAFAQKEIPHYHLEKAKTLLNFGADFLESWLNPVQLTRGFTEMHTYQNGKKGKFLHVAPHMSLTGTNSDQWLPCPAGHEFAVALALTGLLLEKAGHLSAAEKNQLKTYLTDFSPKTVAEKTAIPEKELQKLAHEFNQQGWSLALAGGNCNAGTQATQLQIAVNLLNYVAGNIGNTVVFGADYRIGGGSQDQLEKIIKEMNSGAYQVVIIENVNPVFALPKPSGFARALKNVPLVVSFSTEIDETSELANLHLPVAHSLESWGDSRPRNGIYGLQQPVMAKVPQFKTMEIGDLLLQLAQMAGLEEFSAPNYREYLKNSWKQVQQDTGNSDTFRSFWNRSLQIGGIYHDFRPITVNLSAELFSELPLFPTKKSDGLTLLAVNSNLHNANGKSGNKTWLLEIPHPVTQVVWDSWIEIHPDTAQKLGINHGDLVEVSNSQGKVKVPAWLFHGIHREAAAMPTGMGRSVLFPNYKSSRSRFKFLPILEFKSDLKIVKTKVGVNVMSLLPFEQDRLSGDFTFVAADITIKPTGKKAYLVTMDGQYRDDIATRPQEQQQGFGDRSQKGRGFVRTVALDKIGQPDEIKEQGHKLKERHYTLPRKNKRSFYDSIVKNINDSRKLVAKETPIYHDPHKWEMVIDLEKCTGCSVCVVACYAENNIPVVGKDRAAVGREMSWIRIERYFEPNDETGNLETYYTPQMCAQCDNAGCEPVCPVYATYQTPDGLNAMIYNRCVGTRYCSNNCVYKQRRFNWRTYEFPSPLHMQLNPAVTVREKGIMEKCSFCIQRIREMKDLAKDKGRDVRDGEIQPACQQACPANAITFGNIKDKNSRISKLKSENQRGYHQLEEVNFQPAVTYLKKITHNNRKA